MTTLPPEIEANYEVLQAIGGGMGTVYKVRHRHFDETRIIKVMQASLAENQELKDRFSAEAKLGKLLEHRNIAKVLEFQIGSNGNPYLVMEYIDGINLREEFVRRGGPLDPSMVVNIGVQTLAALGYLHSKNLIHRDLSPDNLMIARDTDGAPLIKLIDLGIANSLEDSSIRTQTGNFIGKISYASPEQFGGGVDARSDFYSLGVVLYELLTMARPITAANTAESIVAHCQKPARPFFETDPEGRVPEQLRRVVLKALEKKPEDRYQTAEEFSTALTSALSASDAVPIATSPPASPPPNLSRAVTLPATAPAPQTLVDRPLRNLADTVIVPTPQSNRSVQTLWLFVSLAVVVAAVIAGLAYLATPLLEKDKGRQIGPITHPQTATGQSAGASIAIEAPKPALISPTPEKRSVSEAAPVIEEQHRSTIGTAPSSKPRSPVPASVSNTLPTATHRATVSPATKVTQIKPVDPESRRTSAPPVVPQAAVPRGFSSEFPPDLARGDRERKEALNSVTSISGPTR